MNYAPKKVKILKKWQFTADTYLLRVDEKAKHDPGQFYELSVLGIGEAPISICSWNPNYVDFLIRNVGNVSGKLVQLDKTMLIRGPYGHGFEMNNFKGNDIIIVGGGTGVAPLRGVIEYIEKNRKDFGDVHLFFGFRSPADILFKDDMDRWGKIFDMHLTVDKPDASWKGNVGVATVLLEKSGLNNHNKIVITIGPPIMIKFTIKTLKSMGFNDDQIFVSHERRMKCGVGKCGHCMIHDKYCCKDGPVFRYDQVKDVQE